MESGRRGFFQKQQKRLRDLKRSLSSPDSASSRKPRYSAIDRVRRTFVAIEQGPRPPVPTKIKCDKQAPCSACLKRGDVERCFVDARVKRKAHSKSLGDSTSHGRQRELQQAAMEELRHLRQAVDVQLSEARRSFDSRITASFAQRLPHPDVTTFLASFSLESAGWHHAAVHAPDFLATMKDFWIMGELEAEEKCPGWLALCFALLVVGMRKLTPDEGAQLGYSPDEMQAACRRWFQDSLDYLHHINFLGSHHLAGLQAIIILTTLTRTVLQMVNDWDIAIGLVVSHAITVYTPASVLLLNIAIARCIRGGRCLSPSPPETDLKL
ncbi:hypothetical protein RQP46_007482 [Phenoliferia psychrophenolica]